MSKLVFNLHPTNSTEAIGIFDMDLFAKGKVGARSLHLFTEQPEEEEFEDEHTEEVEALQSSGGSKGMWVVAALLGAVLSAMGTMYAMQQGANGERSLIVNPSPADAEITVDNQPITAGSPVPMPDSGQELVVRVVKDGFEPYEERVKSTEGTERVLLRPSLAPTPADVPERRNRRNR